MSLSSKVITKLLTRKLAVKFFKCNSCGMTIKSANGYTNVMNHLRGHHPTYEAQAQAAVTDPEMLPLRVVDKRTSDIYRWIDWTVMNREPLTFCERERVKKNTALSSISTKTLKVYMDCNRAFPSYAARYTE